MFIYYLIRIAEFAEHLRGDVDLRGAVDDAGIAGAIEHELITAQVGDILDGVIYLLLDGSHQGCALLVEFALRAEVFLLQVGSLFLLGNDGILLGFLLFLGEEDDLVLVVLVEGLASVVRASTSDCHFLETWFNCSLARS